MKRIHLIAIGGAIMHNLAIALSRKGYLITGSDDAIYDPAKSNLEVANLLPQIGWDKTSITKELDCVILGMHARANNPELLEAQKLNVPIYSFPEFVAKECAGKKRVVVAGSHGKTTTTAMIMYGLNKLGVDFDYLVGSSIDGFDLSVKLSDAPLIIIEGDEYLSSPLDLKSKFLWYDPHLSIITGIAYDHINVFPTFESYLETFRKYIASHQDDGMYFYFEEDEHLAKMASQSSVKNEAYTHASYTVKKGVASVNVHDKVYELNIVGEHNLQNLQAAALVVEQLGYSMEDFYAAMQSFEGAGRRMEKIFDSEGQVVYRDFAHSPSKLQATVKAIKTTYSEKPLLAVFELHTFSSLTKYFLPLYKDSMNYADKAVVYFDADVFEHKKMELLSAEYVASCFGNVTVINDKKELEALVKNSFERKDSILLMSSGKFNGAEFSFG